MVQPLFLLKGDEGFQQASADAGNGKPRSGFNFRWKLVFYFTPYSGNPPHLVSVGDRYMVRDFSQAVLAWFTMERNPKVDMFAIV